MVFYCHTVLRAHARKVYSPVNRIEAVYGRPRESVKVEHRSTFTFTRDLPYLLLLSLPAENLRANPLKIERRSRYVTLPW